MKLKCDEERKRREATLINRETRDNSLTRLRHSSRYLHPISITIIVNIFSASVFGATFPKPTDVKLLKVKYSAVI